LAKKPGQKKPGQRAIVSNIRAYCSLTLFLTLFFPEELALKKQNTKVTISLSSESVAYFKETAKNIICSIKTLFENCLMKICFTPKKR